MFRGRLVVVTVVVLGLVACTGHAPSAKVNRRYVAIGDSYVSGPGINTQDPASPDCGRSNRNYPHLVSAELEHTTLVDVSCGGATAATVQHGRTTKQGQLIAPQLDALTPATKLVTVGVGANDENLYLGLFVDCLIRTSATEASCRKFTESYAPKVYPAARDQVETILSEVKKRSPKARVLLVGYLRIVPDSGDCPILQMTEANRAAAMKVEVALTAALRDAARTAGVEFVDVRGISHGHDACAGTNAWVNGTAKVPGDGGFLHPNEAGMRAVAGQVLKAIGQS